METVEWSRKEVLDFVESYKKRPILWDTHRPNFHNRAEKIKAWREVSDEVGRSVEECRRKVEYLLAAMRREKQKIKKTMGVGRGR